MIIDAIRLSDGAQVEIDVDRLPRVDARFSRGGVRYRRIPNQASGHTTGRGANFTRPVIDYQSPRWNQGPVRADRYDNNGFPVFNNQREIDNYAAKHRHIGINMEWTK